MLDEDPIKTAVASVIFPSNMKFFSDFLKSLNNQTNKRFDLVLFNDGCERRSLQKHLESLEGIRTYIMEGNATKPAEIRVELIEAVKSNGYTQIVFGDTDDFFSINRLELCLLEFESGAEIVVNDLSTISEDGTLIQDRIWKKRLSETEINLEFLLSKNLLGLGNTALRTSLLDFEIELDLQVAFFDWMFYLQVFHQNLNIKTRPIDAITYYRQHELNTIGLNKHLSVEQLKKRAAVKHEVLKFAEKLKMPNTKLHLEKLRKFEEEILQNRDRFTAHVLLLNKIDDLFWFEEINLFDEIDTA